MSDFDYSIPETEVGDWGEPPRTSGEAPPVFDRFAPQNVGTMNLTKLVPRQLLYGRLLLKGHVSCLVGSGGVGKTSLAMGIGMSVATGKRYLSLAEDDEADDYHGVFKSGPVMYYNLEDPQSEMNLRIAAEILHRHVNQDDLDGQFFLASGREHPLCLAHLDAKGRAVRNDITPAAEMAKRLGLVLLIIDPVVNSHGLDGNKNEHLVLIVDQLRRLADQAQIAVLMLHHVRKGGAGKGGMAAGDVESSLGAVSLTNGCRVVETVTAMTLEDAAVLAIPPQQRRGYIRMDNAKNNLAAPLETTDWYQFHSVALHNGDADYPHGDCIGVLVPWKPLSPMRNATWSQVERMLDLLDAGITVAAQGNLAGIGTADIEYYSSAKHSQRWAGGLLVGHLAVSPEYAAALLKEWVQSGVVVKGEYISRQRSRQKAERLMTTAAGREKLRLMMAARV